MSRQELDLTKLDQFTPRTADDAALPADSKPITAAHQHTPFPSREPLDEAQLNIKLPRAEATRFRHLAKADRYTLGAFLTLLMDEYERKG